MKQKEEPNASAQESLSEEATEQEEPKPDPFRVAVVDIETYGEDYEQMDPLTQKELIPRWAQDKHAAGAMDDAEFEHRVAQIKDRTALSPFTGKIVTIGIGVWTLDKNTGAREQARRVLYLDPEASDDPDLDRDLVSINNEPDMLTLFWRWIRHFNWVVTYNGRNFDAPFLIHRSAHHRIPLSVNLMQNRYLNSQYKPPKHIDLYDQFTYYGAVSRSVTSTLHMLCRHCGIESPKGDVGGADVQELFDNGEYERIARYNLADIRATFALFKVWYDHYRFDEDLKPPSKEYTLFEGTA